VDSLRPLRLTTESESMALPDEYVGNLLLFAATWYLCHYRQCHAPFDPFFENIMSFTELEVRNILHWHYKRTEPWLRLTCTQNCVKFEHVVFEICSKTDRHTNTLLAVLCTPAFIFINCVAGAIIRLVASIHPFVCGCSPV